MRRFVLNATVLVVATLVTVGACELVARRVSPELLTGPDERVGFCDYDAELGWVNRPGVRGRFMGTTVVHDSDGLRDPERTLAKVPGRLRVMVLGDSFVWGYRVEAEDRFTNVLEKKLPDAEIINFGCSGYGQDQEYLLLQREFPRYRPDLVVVAVHVASDLENDSYSFQYGYHKPYFELKRGRLVLRNVPVPRDSLGTRVNKWMTGRSALWNLLADRVVGGESLRARFVRRLDELGGDTGAKVVRVRTPRAIMACRLAIAIRDFVASRHARLLFMLIPNVEVTHQRIETVPEYDGLRVCLHASGAPVLDLEPVFHRYLAGSPGAAVTLKGDRHWSKEGHEVVANALYDWLEAQREGDWAIGSAPHSSR
jgi:hypothetical protein